MASKTKRKYLSQSDVPSYELFQALRIAEAITENYAGQPTKPLHVATALDMAPTSSHFRKICGASIAYGLTEGGYNANEIALTDLGKRATKPLEDGDDFLAKQTAFLKPRVISEFITQYDGSPFPSEKIAANVLEDMGVPLNKAAETFKFIIDTAKKLNLTQEIKGKVYGDLSGEHVDKPQSINDDTQPNVETVESAEAPEEKNTQLENKEISTDSINKINKNVFITHGRDTSFIAPIKKLLAFGELTPVVSVEKQSVSKPVPEKVMDDMRKCGAAIIHVNDDQKLLNTEAEQVTVINSNVLIEIGAAMALYGKRFILLVKDGVALPSNLQGLYEVRYSGESLDGDATIKLLEAINEMKNLTPPT